MSEIIEYLFENKAIEIKESKPFFIWASGKESPIYCDNRKLLSCPKARDYILDCFIDMSKDYDFDGIAAVATAGISWGTLIAHKLKLPLIYIRDKAKSHGRQNQIEGDSNKIKRALVIEDLISTGKSSLKACDALSENHIKVEAVLSIFNYNLAIAQENFSNQNISYDSLESINSLLESDYINISQKEFLKEFLCS